MLAEPFFKIFNEVLQELGVSGYLCGGTVRDLLLNRSFRDVDVVLPERVFAAAQLFRSKIDAPYFVLDRERQVARVVCGGGNWDFSGFRGIAWPLSSTSPMAADRTLEVGVFSNRCFC